MIIGINGFSSIADATLGNASDINLAIGNIRRFQPNRPGTEVFIGSYDYSSTSHIGIFNGTGMQLQPLGTNSFAAYTIPSMATIIKEPGDTLTVGCRLVIQTAHAAQNPVVAAFYSGTINAVPTYAAYLGNTTTTNVYVEIEITMLAVGSYRYRAWSNGIMSVNAERADLLPSVSIGTALSWKPSTNPSGAILFRDMYWAFNKEGKEERLGPCTVTQVPREVTYGVGNPGAATAGDITKQRATWDLGSSSVTPPYTPVTLVSPVVQKVSMASPNPNMRIKALKMPTVGKSSIAGTTGVVTSQILDENGEIVSSRSQENALSTYINGVSVAFVDVSDIPIEKVTGYQFVSSREKAPNV